jgi:hypothetical protein
LTVESVALPLHNRHHFRDRLRLHLVLAAGWLAAANVPAPVAAASDDLRAATAAPVTRFSDLAEITTANVGRLLPLITQSVPREDPPVASGAIDAIDAIDVSLQRFVAQRTDQMDLLTHAGGHPRVGNSAVSYLVAAGGAERTPGSSARPEVERCELRAWNPTARQVLWSVREPLPISSSTLVTAGGLVFYGTGDGWIKALDARTGRTLWKHRADGRRLDQPVSYRGADGHQYIAVRALPRAASNTPGDGRATVLLFALAN